MTRGPLERIVQIEDRYYVLAAATLADHRVRILKEQETFAVLDRYGDIHRVSPGYQGVYVNGTRYLSELALTLAGDHRPLLLNSTVLEDSDVMVADLTNPDLEPEEGGPLKSDTVHIRRHKVLGEGSCSEELVLRNFGREPVAMTLFYRFAADYADIFEVRGAVRPRRGQLLPPGTAGGDMVSLGYLGLDGVERRTVLHFSPPPAALSTTSARYRLTLAPGEVRAIEVAVCCRERTAPARCDIQPHAEVRARAEADSAAMRRRWCKVESSNALFDAWLRRSFEDLRMLSTQTEHGPYPYAGTPWFSAAFGRDGLVTALETLWVDPRLSAGVLEFLAATQATEHDPARDAEPGKILHERRGGEMAALGEIPFGRYYGSIDATPLFVFLAGRHLERTGDLALAGRLWPAVERALAWIERDGDRDGDGFVEYQRRAETGLVNQGWKDSNDSVFDASGEDVPHPIALCEVQAYVYGAYRGGARLATALGERGRAADLEARAAALRRRFREAFWSERLELFALALDGRKRRCEVASSNAGQCLLTGIVEPEDARRMAARLLSPELFSGWGVRTLSREAPRYNPLSYHNGSVWPHDTALVAAGLARYGFTAPALVLFDAMFAAARSFDLNRLPELFCGFERGATGRPVLYPVACVPQAWAAGAPFLLLQAALGLRIDGARQVVELHEPRLPEWLEWVELRELSVGGGGWIDLLIRRHGQGVVIEVGSREPDTARLLVVK